MNFCVKTKEKSIIFLNIMKLLKLKLHLYTTNSFGRWYCILIT